MEKLKKGEHGYLVSFYHGRFRAMAKLRVDKILGTYYHTTTEDILYDNIYDLIQGMPSNVGWERKSFYRENELGKLISERKRLMIKEFFLKPEYIGGTS